MSDWRIFKGNSEPHDEIDRLPDPPNWRSFASAREGEKLSLVDFNWDSKTKAVQRGQTFRVGENTDLVDIVNAALYLRRPLLITGKPGAGKTSLAYAVAYELKLGPVLLWPITARSTLQEGLYRYDAIARLQDAQLSKESNANHTIGRYIQLGPVGTALLPYKRPRVLLIDEIDKSDINLPNDLLNLFEEGEFEIPELARLSGQEPEVPVRTYDGNDATIKAGRIRCHAFPCIVLTSNGERDFPPAFLRRCLRLTLPQPNEAALTAIVKAHLGDKVLEKAQPLIQEFLHKRDKGDLATDQLLNAIYLATRKSSSGPIDRDKLNKLLLQYISGGEEQ
jgi:MoxR-like ATPases